MRNQTGRRLSAATVRSARQPRSLRSKAAALLAVVGAVAADHGGLELHLGRLEWCRQGGGDAFDLGRRGRLRCGVHGQVPRIAFNERP
jgi:hypothetical protein